MTQRAIPHRTIPIRMVLFPAALTAAVAGTIVGLQTGLPAIPLQLGSFLGALLIVALAERWFADDVGDAPGTGPDWKVDGLSFGVIIGLVNPVLELGLPLLAAGLLAAVSLPATFHLFPNHWPLAAQLALAAVTAEFGQYWMHRLAHEWPPLWRFHACHHSSERLYWLNGFRTHPLNVAWHHLAGVFLLKLLGASPDILAVYLAMAAVVFAFQHANLDLVHGPLNWIFATNELHRWHHADLPEQGNRNYGGVLSIWDLVFGSYLRVRGERPARYGLYAGNEFYPRDNWWRQLVIPFSWPRERAQARERGPHPWHWLSGSLRRLRCAAPLRCRSPGC